MLFHWIDSRASHLLLGLYFLDPLSWSALTWSVLTLVPATVSEVDAEVFLGAGALSLDAESLLGETTVSVAVSAKPLEALFSSVVDKAGY